MEFWIGREQCTGCAACANACLENAILLQWNEDGYPCPVINQELCIDCGRCASVCPVLSRINEVPDKAEEEEQAAQVYAAWSRDEEIRSASSSGGIFSELAKVVLEQGGAVCGAGYDENNMVCHKIVNSEELLSDLRQSKYVQSQINEVYRDIQQLLTQGTQVLFCGAACQVAGLLSFLGDEHENLVTVDFICHGVNSPLAYQAWIEELEQEYGAKATNVLFRNKEDGWHAQSTRVDFENGAIYRKNRYEDLFKRAFLRYELMIRPSCTQCKFKELKRQADLTLGDFWKVDKELDDNLGISSVMVNSEKGAVLFKQMEQRIVAHPSTYEDVLRGNATLRQSTTSGAGREEFLALLKKGTTFSQAYRTVTGEDVPLMGEIKALEKDRTFLKNKAAQLEKKSAILTEKTVALEKDRAFLKKKVERSEENCAALTEKNAVLEKDRAFLKNKADRLEKSGAILTEKAAGLERERDLLSGKAEHWEKNYTVLTEKTAVLEKDRAFLKNKTEQLEKDCAVLNEKTAGLGRERDLLTEKAEHWEKNYTVLTEKAADLEKDRALLKDKAEQLEKDCAVLTERAAGLERERDLLNEKAEHWEKSYTVLTEKATELEKELGALQYEKTALENDIAVLKECIAGLEKDRVFLKNKSRRLELVANEFQGALFARIGLKIHRLFRRIKGRFFTRKAENK